MIQLVIADHVFLHCETLATVLNAEPDIEVVEVATSTEQALEKIENTACHLALVSSNFPEGGALSLTRSVKSSCPQVRVIVTGMTDNEAIIMRYIEAGAMGYVLRDEPIEVLLKKIRAAFEEQALVTPEIAATLIERASTLTARLIELGVDPADYDTLTAREKEILDLVADGLTNQDIADGLTIEIGTVKNHVHNILDKLNVHTRQDAAIYLSLIEREQEPTNSSLLR